MSPGEFVIMLVINNTSWYFTSCSNLNAQVNWKFPLWFLGNIIAVCHSASVMVEIQVIVCHQLSVRGTTLETLSAIWHQ